MKRALLFLCLFCSLIGCGTTTKYKPKKNSKYKHSYVVKGRRYYVLKSSAGFRQRGIASWYGKPFHGRKAADGKAYNMYAMTAAHKTLPLGTYIKVTNLHNGRSVVVKVTDRGPYKHARILDLSYRAAKKLKFVKTGIARIEIRALRNKRKKR